MKKGLLALARLRRSRHTPITLLFDDASASTQGVSGSSTDKAFNA
jgi:hypothetical protein